MLVGRELLLQACDRALRDSLRGRGRLLLLAGEAGIGKTTLAAAINERGADAGAVIRTGACWETEALPPFTPWLQALRHPSTQRASAAAERLVGGDGESTDALAARRALGRRFTEVVDALRDEATTAPQIVVLEDLHWADEPSIELLTAVAAHLPSMPVLVVATYRADELPQTAAFGSIGGNADRLWLGGLDDVAVALLLTDALGRAPSASELTEVQRQTSGNPLFVTQVGRLLDAGPVLVPSGIRGVIDRRLARVSAKCNEVLGAASVLGADVDGGVLGEMVDQPASEALEEAVGAGLVDLVDHALGQWRFVHALVRNARYEQLGSAERARLHRSALDALAKRPEVSAATLAHHATRAGLAIDDGRPATLLVRAGVEALDRMAWSDAIASFERAMALAPSSEAGDEALAEAWLGIGAARLRLGTGDLRAAFDAAAAVARRAGRPDLLARAALGFSVGLGAFEVRLIDHHQVELLEEAAGALADDDLLLPLVLARLSVALAFVEPAARRVALAERAIALAREADQPVALGYALASWCDAMAGPVDVAQRAAAAVEIIALAERAADLPLELLGRRLRVVTLLERSSWVEFDAEVVAYEHAAERLGDPLYTWYVRLWRAARAQARGEIAVARRFIEEASALGMEGSSINSAVLAQVFTGMAGLDRRDRSAAFEMLDSMLRMMPAAMTEYVHCTHAYVEALLGDGQAASASLDQIDSSLVTSLPRDSEWLCSIIQLACASIRADNQRMAAIVLPLLEPVADVGGVEGIGAYLHGSAHRYVAFLHAMHGDAPATRHHVDAAQRAARGGGALLEALVDLDGARALQRAGDPEDAIRAAALAGVAASVFTSIGLEALAIEAHALALGPLAGAVVAEAAVVAEEPGLVRRGDIWTWTWEGVDVQIRHAKGVADLAVLIERGGREVHVRELEGLPAGSGSGGRHDVLDHTAVQQYRQRLQDIEEDLDEADRHGDLGRAASLAAERDALVDQLTSAFGLGGRPRQAGSDPDERLRKAVSARVRASVDRIEALNPALGKHLRRSVRTGFWCSYQPEHRTEWRVTRS